MTVRLSTMPVLGDGGRSSAGNGRKLHIVVAVEGAKTLLSRCGKRSQPSPRSLSYLLEMMDEEPITVEKLITATGTRNPKKYCMVCVKLSPIPMGGRRKKKTMIFEEDDDLLSRGLEAATVSRSGLAPSLTPSVPSG